MSSLRRRPQETDPVVAARLQAISFADPYVFVHANDVLDLESAAFEDFSALPSDPGPGAGWLPQPPVVKASSPAPPPPPAHRASLTELVRRLEPAGGGVIALLVLGLIAAAAAGFLLLRAQPSRSPLQLPAGSAAASASLVASGAPLVKTPSPSPASTSLLVDVTGKVHHPGVVQVSAGARVLDAVRAAGGALPGTSMDTLNLAARVTDGQQVAVGAAAAAAGAAVAQGGASDAADASVDLNSATIQQLQTLPGIGPVLAQRILDYRSAHGPFASVDGLQQVGGIGPSKFAQIKDHVSV